MLFLAGFLLLCGLHECDAFWALVTFVERLLPNYYAADLKGSVADLKVLDDMVFKELPDLANKMEQIGVFKHPF